MTVNEAIEAAGPGVRMEGLTDGIRVIGFRVMSYDDREIARFIDMNIELGSDGALWQTTAGSNLDRLRITGPLIRVGD